MTNGNDPAFPENPNYEYTDPIAGDFTAYKVHKVGGLTKREYFAAMAMMGIAKKVDQRYAPEVLALDAVNMADALIKELSK